MSKPGVFYFDFFDGETEKTVMYGFIMNMLSENLEEELDDSYDDKLEELESEYGVHDWSSSPNEAVSGIGYTSYEVEPDRHLELMGKWQQYFDTRDDVENVSHIVLVSESHMDEDIQHLDDYDIYRAIKEKLEAIINKLAEAVDTDA